MKRFTSIKEAENAVKELVNYWSDVFTITDIKTTKGLKNGLFIDMTSSSVSLYFLQELSKITGDNNPVIFPIDEETITIGTYVIINDSDE